MSFLLAPFVTKAKDLTMQSPEETWLAYAGGNVATAQNLVEPRYATFFLNTLKPGSSFVKVLKVSGSRRIGKSSAALDLEIPGYKTWIALKSNGKDWKLTLDETEILEGLTTNWKKTKVGKFLFVTRRKMTDEQVSVATRFANRAEQVAEKLRIQVPEVTYYVAKNEKDAEVVVGENHKGAGRGRYRSIKTVGRFDHIHEFVHVLAMEIGLINPFFDEGLAAAYEDGTRFKNRDDCVNTVKRLGENPSLLLDGPTFMEANFKQKLNVYGVAQETMRYWIEKFGVLRIKKVMERTAGAPEGFLAILESELEPVSSSMKTVKARMQKHCQAMSI